MTGPDVGWVEEVAYRATLEEWSATGGFFVALDRANREISERVPVAFDVTRPAGPGTGDDLMTGVLFNPRHTVVLTLGPAAGTLIHRVRYGVGVGALTDPVLVVCESATMTVRGVGSRITIYPLEVAGER